MQDPGQPGDAGTANRKVRKPRQLGEPSAGAKGERIRGDPGTQTRGKAGRCGVRGNSQPCRKAQLEARSRGATRSTSTRCAEGRETRGNSRVRRRQSRKMQEPGQPGKCIGRRNWRGEIAGKPGVDATDALKDARFGATRRSIAGKAGRCKSRGDPGDASRGANGELKRGET